MPKIPANIAGLTESPNVEATVFSFKINEGGNF